VPAAYAIERPWSKQSMNGSGCLISIWNYKSHPITRKIRATSWLGGAPLTTDHGIAFLSKNGHVDFGNYITHKPSKHSNRRVDPGEYQGPGIPIMAAVEKGKGRVVVIGDHNMLGMQWLGVADNYRFAVNAFAWLSKRENESPHIADNPPKEVIIGVDLSHSEWHIGARDRGGFHPGFVNLSRHPDVFPMGLLSIDDPADVYTFFDPFKPFTSNELATLERYLGEGKRLVLVFDPSEPQKGSMSLLGHFFPNLIFQTANGQVSLDMLKKGAASPIPKMSGAPIPAYSAELGINGIPMGALKPKSYKGKGTHRRPDKIAEGKPYLLDFQIEQGAPFVTGRTEDGRDITIARKVKVLGGEIILIPQAKMWNNETMGTMRDEPYNETGRGAFEFQMRFVDWLSTKPPISDADQHTSFKTDKASEPQRQPAQSATDI
jgi:hypothetical protein